MEDKVVDKGIWNREISTHHLLCLLEEAQKELEINGLTKSTVAGLINSVKELNKLYGLSNPPKNFNNLPQIIFTGKIIFWHRLNYFCIM
ncbi:hypothetical protein AAIR98_001477 [Elusimicrobium simillimum]|uniref:hypothetical protein n=1 Tax=Elusimicrobium simillimum TaxID=3143438 RepID=UPI003C6F8051